MSIFTHMREELKGDGNWPLGEQSSQIGDPRIRRRNFVTAWLMSDIANEVRTRLPHPSEKMTYTLEEVLIIAEYAGDIGLRTVFLETDVEEAARLANQENEGQSKKPILEGGQ